MGRNAPLISREYCILFFGWKYQLTRLTRLSLFDAIFSIDEKVAGLRGAVFFVTSVKKLYAFVLKEIYKHEGHEGRTIRQN